MAKRKLTSERGWIEFKGLQFVEPFKITRSELIQHIHAFFAERGLRLDSQDKVVIQFSQRRNPCSTEFGFQVAGEALTLWTYRRRVMTIWVYLRTRSGRGEFVETLFHELDHWAWALEGRVFDRSADYWTRSHEVRARVTGAAYREKLGR